MRSTAFMSLCILLTCTAANSAEQPPLPRALLAVSKVEHTLSVIDPASLRVVARLPVGPDPHEVVASADGSRAYVSNTGYGLFHEIDVLDLNQQRAMPAIDTSPWLGPHGLAWVEGKLWFTAQGAKAVARFDPASEKVDWAMGTGQDTTHLLHVAEDGKALYTTNTSRRVVGHRLGVRKWVAPIQYLSVPKGCSTVCWRTFIFPGSCSNRRNAKQDQQTLTRLQGTPDSRLRPS